MDTTYATTAFPTQYGGTASSMYLATGLTAIESEKFDADPQENARRWCLIAVIGTIVVSAVVVAVLAVVILSRESTGDSTDFDDDVLSGGNEGSGQGDVVNPVVQIPRTTSTTTESAVTGYTAPLTVCTVTGGAEPLYFPDDGLCTSVFFDSLGVTHRTNDFSVARQSATAVRFVTQGRVGHKTRYGMSVSFRDAENFGNAFRTPKGKADYESYWSFNVYDWGFLSIDELQVEARHSDVIFVLTALKEIQEHALSKNAPRPQTFLGIYLRTSPVCAAVAEYIKTIFTPTGVVVLGHLSYADNTRSDCVIMPPVNFVDPRTQKPGITYGHRMRDATLALACLWEHNVRTNMSLSVTMRARRYKLKSGSQGKPPFYSDCEVDPYEQRTTAQEICDNPNSGYSTNINYDDVFMSLMTYDHAGGFAITFENRGSLRYKICSAWTLEATDIGVGLAMYDVNYDRRSTMCDPMWINGTWSRLRFLLRLRDFLQQPHPEASVFGDCLRVT